MNTLRCKAGRSHTSDSALCTDKLFQRSMRFARPGRVEDEEPTVCSYHLDTHYILQDFVINGAFKTPLWFNFLIRFVASEVSDKNMSGTAARSPTIIVSNHTTSLKVNRCL